MDRTRSNRPPLLGSVSRYSRAGSIERVVFCENRSATKGRAASGSVLTTDVACTAVGVQTTRTLTSYQSVTHQRTRRRQGSTQFFETIARSLTVANNRTLPPPSNCQGAEHTLSLRAYVAPQKHGDPLETYRIDGSPRCRLVNRRARRPPTDRPVHTEGHCNWVSEEEEDCKSASHSSVGWAGAIEALSRSRSVMVPFVVTPLELVARRRTARRCTAPRRELITRFTVRVLARSVLKLFRKLRIESERAVRTFGPSF